MVSEVTVDNKEDQPCVKIAKKRLQRAVIEFKRHFADYPTKALDELLSEESVSRMVEEETGNYRERTYPPLTTQIMKGSING